MTTKDTKSVQIITEPSVRKRRILAERLMDLTPEQETRIVAGEHANSPNYVGDDNGSKCISHAMWIC